MHDVAQQQQALNAFLNDIAQSTKVSSFLGEEMQRINDIVQSAKMSTFLGEEMQRIAELSTIACSAMKPSLQIDMPFIYMMNDWSSQLLLQVGSQLAASCLETTHQLFEQYAHLITFWPVMSQLDIHASILMDRPAIEIWQHAHCIKLVAPSTAIPAQESQQLLMQLAEENATELERWLAQKHPSLCSMWRGARQAFLSNNPDRVRQVMVSLRTLLDHLLFALAPDTEVRAWSAHPSYYEKKKILRKGRLYYICRHVNDDTFSKFMEANVNAVLSLASSLNNLHELENFPIEQQVRVLLNRFESALLFLRELGDK